MNISAVSPRAVITDEAPKKVKSDPPQNKLESRSVRDNPVQVLLSSLPDSPVGILLDEKA